MMFCIYSIYVLTLEILRFTTFTDFGGLGDFPSRLPISDDSDVTGQDGHLFSQVRISRRVINPIFIGVS